MERVNQLPVYAFDCHRDRNTSHGHENKFCEVLRGRFIIKVCCSDQYEIWVELFQTLNL